MVKTLPLFSLMKESFLHSLKLCLQPETADGQLLFWNFLTQFSGLCLYFTFSVSI